MRLRPPAESKSPERLLPARPRHEAVYSWMAIQILPPDQGEADPVVALDQFFRRHLDPLIFQKHLILAVLDHPLGIGQTGDISAVAAAREPLPPAPECLGA